ncbi:thiamine diphosphate-binding protein [Suillus lakei]|nr:thiamine diphosphate-binding protein [Suillus lakei]
MLARRLRLTFPALSRRWQTTASTATIEPPSAGGHSSSVASSQLLRMTRESAIRTPVPVIFGEDIAFGGVFRCTMGLAEEFGRERVFNTPLTEQGIAGFGIGLASMGHTAIAEIQLSSPALPIQCKGLLSQPSAIHNPCIFMEPKVLYRSAVEQVPIDDFALPLSSAEILIPGSDLTLLTWGTPVYHLRSCPPSTSTPHHPPRTTRPTLLRSAKVELIDLRTILPWDIETVVESVR